MVTLAFVSARTVSIGSTPLVGSTDLEWSTVFALEFGTEELAISGRFEVVVVSKSSVVGEGNASALFRIVVVSA